MKKFVIKISLAIVMIAGVLLILLGLRSCDRGIAPPSYSFLAGRNPIACNEQRNDEILYKQKCYIYSFEADFNDVCSKADAELIPEGFVGTTVVDKFFSDVMSSLRVYYLKGRFPRGPVWISIYDNRQCTELPNPQKDALYMKDGWITIEVG